MLSFKFVFGKRRNSLARCLAVAVALLFCQNVFAAGPTLMNVNPQGTVTNANNVVISLDTEDLARCRYSTVDTSYNSMGNDLDTPDGLYHSVNLGSLGEGAHTYYVRCKDFEGNANSSSAEVSFTVGDIGCIGANCPTYNPPTGGDTTPPTLSGLLPTGTTYNGYVVLSVTTDEAAACRYSWYDKSYDAMTLQFTTSDKLYHTTTAALSNYGYYNYYVRCKDESGNINQTAGRITFTYKTTYTYTPPVTTTPSDTTPPSISGLMPSGAVKTKEVTLSLSTDETASCKYGKSDLDYDLLTDSFDAMGKSHTAGITLDAPGDYTYYVRCEDEEGNQNSISAEISFTYEKSEGPKIYGIQPEGVIYQDLVALIINSEESANCRYADRDIDFDQMGDFFDTSDGLLHQAAVDLGSYGFYTYYVRCEDEEGNINENSEVISFEYKNPNPDETVSEDQNGVSSEEITCEQIQVGAEDGVCDLTKDCICDPDCPLEGEDADSDCEGVQLSSGGNAWVAVLFIALILLIVIIIIIILLKKRGTEEEDVELP